MMELATTKTEWPAVPVPAKVKKLINDLFFMMDKNGPEVPIFGLVP